MDKLEAMIKPEIGVLTHIGTAHDEGFKNRREKVLEKLKLFKNSQRLICNYDVLTDYRADILAKETFTWSRKFNQADLYVFSGTVISKNYYLRAYYKKQEIECLVPFTDEASIENAIVCWATMLALGYSPVEADKRIERLAPVSMRLELKNGVNNCSVIDDTYNSDLQSLEIALNFLGQQNQHHKKTLILSDIYQSGLAQEVLYQQVADLVAGKKVDKFIGVGDALVSHKDYFNVAEAHFFKDTAAMLQNLKQLDFKDETILIKGSRSFEFERISRALAQKAHETVLEINLNTLLSNLNFYKSKLEARSKGNGHGKGV
jgi:UDP-N-acetylmuramyl pentapeptide synthase